MKYFFVLKDKTLGEVAEHEGFLGDALDPERKSVISIPVNLNPLMKELISEALSESDDFAFYLSFDFRIHIEKQKENYRLELHCRGWDGPVLHLQPIRDEEELFRVLQSAFESFKSTLATSGAIPS